MSLLKFGFSGIFLTLFLACGSEDASRDFSLDLGNTNRNFTHGEFVRPAIRSRSGRPVDSVRYFLGGQALKTSEGRLQLVSGVLGTHTFEARIFSEGTEVNLDTEITLLAETPPEIYTYEIVNTFPHDMGAFTQGLEFVGDILYESTGQKGASGIRKVAFETGEILAKTDLEDSYFGEGITVMGDTLYMLTWQSGTGFLYNPENLERIGSFSYGQSKEGWGLCNDGTTLYKSDGSERIWKLDPRTQRETGHLETVTDKSVFNKANELEYVDGKIYANVWQKPSMMIIDARSGAIEGVVNFGGLEKQVTQHDRLDVFNGVAYHRGRGTFFVTGKRWDKLFEVRIVKREK